MIFKSYSAGLGILFLTLSPLWAEEGFLGWIEGKGTQDKADPCTLAFPGTKSHPTIPNACYYCPQGGSVPTGPAENPSCSIAGTNLNACKTSTSTTPEGVLIQKPNICIVCLPGKKYSGNDCI